MDWKKSHKKDRNKQPRPKYINFPISFFRKLKGERLAVPKFKAMVADIISYGIADWYRREFDAWHDSQEYYQDVFDCVLVKMGIEFNLDEMNYFYDEVLPSMKKVTRSAGHAFCGIPIPWLISFLNDDKSDFECLQFLAYCAIRSILGRGLFDDCFPVPKRITWEFILSRMAGNDKRVPVEDLPPFIAAYAIRRKRDKLRKSLIYKWHLQTDGQSRGPGGAYYMIHDSISIAQAIEDLQKFKQATRKRRATKDQADTDRPP